MDIDENSLDSSVEQHQNSKTAHTPSNLKSELTNGTFGMEAEDSDHSNEAFLRQNDEEQKPEASSGKETEAQHHQLELNCESEHLNGVEDNLPAAELSPNLRRSTRASALKAQEKIRLKDGTTVPIMVDSHIAENDPVVGERAGEISVQTTAADTEQQMELPIKKKRKLSNSDMLDQFDCKFGIRLDNDGDVVMMSDGSEISSLNEEEAAVVRQRYLKITAKEESEMSVEKAKEREFQVRDLESILRLEEAKLAMLKKIRANQQLTTRNLTQQTANRLNIAQNTSGTAYKPPIAQQNAAKINGALATSKNQRGKTIRPSTSPAGNFQLTPQHQAILQKLVEQGALRPDQLAAILHSINPAALSALSQANVKNHREQLEKERLREQQEKERKLKLEQEAAQRKAALEAAEAARSAQTTQQRIASARTQLRRHLEQQLLQLPPPKAPIPDMNFIPNATQPDFLYLLGLDLVVQRNLKDKTVFKRIDLDPYVCEECGTDFTPNWKAISGDKEDLHLYCEQCVRQAQKRKVRHERTILYKKAFQKIAEQEKEFERQVSSGKFNEAVAKDAAKEATTSAQNNILSKTASNFNAAALSSLNSSAAAKAFGHSALSLLNSSNANRNLQNNLSARNQVKQEPPKKPLPTTPAAQTAPSRKRTVPASGSSNTGNVSAFASIANNPAFVNMLQQVNSVPAAMRMNPMFTSMMANPQLLAQFYSTMMQQQQNQQQQNQQQQRSSSSSSSNTGSNNSSMSAILQVLAQGVRSSSSNHSSSSSASNNPLSQMNPALLQQLAAVVNQSRKK